MADRAKQRTAAVALIAALALVGAGCTTEEDGRVTTGAATEQDGEDRAAGRVDPATFCDRWDEFHEEATTGEDDLRIEDVDGLALLEELAAVAPEGVRDDMDDMVGGFRIFAELEETEPPDAAEESEAALDRIEEAMTTVIVASENVKDWLVEECGMTAEETGIENTGIDDATMRDLRGEDPPDAVTDHIPGDPVPVEHLGELCWEFTDLVTDLRGVPPEEVVPHVDAPQHNPSSAYEQQNCRFSYAGDDWPLDEHHVTLQTAFGATAEVLRDESFDPTAPGTHPRETVAEAERLGLGDEASVSTDGPFGRARMRVLVDDLVVSIRAEVPFGEDLGFDEDELVETMRELLDRLEWD